MSDYVIDNMPAEERDAVIAHEIGHLQHMRILLVRKFAFYSGYVTALLFLLPLCSVYFAGNVLPKIAIIYGSFLLLKMQNKISRRYELEADRFAIAAVGSEAFARSIEKIREVNLLPRKFDEKGREKLPHPSLDIRTAAAIEPPERDLNR